MRAQRIKEQIKQKFPQLEKLDIVDESHMHAGRAGQESHFKVMVVCSDFEGMNRVQRQRTINALLQSEFDGGLHALSMRLLTPEEFSKQTQAYETPDCAGKNASS